MASRTIRTVNVMTDGAGAFSTDVSYRGQLIAVKVELGDLSTPDIALSDSTDDRNLLTVAGIAADAVYHLQAATADPADGTAGDSFVAPAVFGGVTVAVTGGGATKVGKIKLLFG